MTEPGSGAAQFAVASEAGSLLYVPGGPNVKRKELVWIDREGAITPCGAPLGAYDVPRLSPDGSRIALTLFGATDAVVVYDLRDRSTTRVAADGNCSMLGWHPDGRQVLVSSDVEGTSKQSLFLANADGTGKARRLAVESPITTSYQLVRLPDGLGLVSALNYRVAEKGGLFLSHLDSDRGTERLDEFGEVAPSRPALSPDGRWLAYDAGPAESREVFVRPFPTGNGSWQISHGGGGMPVWAPSGDEIVYQRSPEMKTPVDSVKLSFTSRGITAAPSREIFQIPVGLWLSGFHPDGKRLVAAKAVPQQFPGDRVLLILNWFDQVHAKASGR